MRGREVAMAEALEHPAGDVGAAWVLHGVVVGEGNFFQQRAIRVRSNAAQPPSVFCMLSRNSMPRCPAAEAASPPVRLKAIATIAVSSTSG